MIRPPLEGKFYQIQLPLTEAEMLRFKSWLPVNSMSPARQQEYIAGRICAFEAAKLLSIDLHSLPSGSKREPQWPNELVGSISHTKELAVAWVDFKTNSLSLGIDVEHVISEQRYLELAQQVASVEEIQLLNSHATPHLAFTLLFSAKEALFKALYPLCHHYIDFKEVEWFGVDGDDWEIRLASNRSEIKSLNRVYRGQWQRAQDLVMTSIRLS
jgi:enterobactin synthetase component D